MTSKNLQEQKESKNSYKRKCVVCGEYIVDEEGVPYKGRYAHSKCFQIVVKTLHTNKQEEIKEKTKEGKKRANTNSKIKAELKEALDEEEYKNKTEYYDYLRMLLDTEHLSAKIYVVTEDYIKRYGFNFKGMKQTLVYLKEIIEKDLVGDVVGLIPYYYTQAIAFYQSIEDIKKQNENKSTVEMYDLKVIKIKPKQRKIKQIDIELI